MKSRLDTRYLQTRATPCNAYWLTPNEQVSGSSPLVGSFDPAYLSRINATGGVFRPSTSAFYIIGKRDSYSREQGLFTTLTARIHKFV